MSCPIRVGHGYDIMVENVHAILVLYSSLDSVWSLARSNNLLVFINDCKSHFLFIIDNSLFGLFVLQ